MKYPNATEIVNLCIRIARDEYSDAIHEGVSPDGAFDCVIESLAELAATDCDCGITEPYGFVSEAGCPIHDRKQVKATGEERGTKQEQEMSKRLAFKNSPIGRLIFDCGRIRGRWAIAFKYGRGDFGDKDPLIVVRQIAEGSLSCPQIGPKSKLALKELLEKLPKIAS